jgi:cation diffusion facilitator CzcD-associated flavoprotein CzcO
MQSDLPLCGIVPAAFNPIAPSLKLAPRRLAPVPENPNLPRVCIIGAGSSGIALAKQLYEAGVPFDCFERGERVGGIWAFKNKSGASTAYRSLHTITSRDRNAYSDFPMPSEYPDFPHHALMQRYFDAYVDWFGFRHKITLEMGVKRARQCEDGVWEVTLDGGEVRFYDVVCPAVGQYWSPVWPDPRPEGEFGGIEMHSSAYKDPRDPYDLLDKRVVIVGFGNSALDIACELSRKENCQAADLSVRRGAWVAPRHFGPKVCDAWRNHVASPREDREQLNLRAMLRKLAPGRLRSWLRLKQIEAAIGLPHQVGLPIPPEPWGVSPALISSELSARTRLGDLSIKPAIRRFEGKRVFFTDGSVVEADAVIWCTGYKRSFPFFEGADAAWPQDGVSLWMQIVDPAKQSRMYVGCVSAAGSAMPLAEQQAIFIKDILTGRFTPPSTSTMNAELAKARVRVEAGHQWEAYAAAIDSNLYVDALHRAAATDVDASDRAPAIKARARFVTTDAPSNAQGETASS